MGMALRVGFRISGCFVPELLDRILQRQFSCAVALLTNETGGLRILGEPELDTTG
jgi:hypothetical protein